MQLIIDQVGEVKRANARDAAGEEAGTTSATSFLLDQLSGRRPN
jgi:hypothetical protein